MIVNDILTSTCYVNSHEKDYEKFCDPNINQLLLNAMHAWL